MNRKRKLPKELISGIREILSCELLFDDEKERLIANLFLTHGVIPFTKILL